MKLLHNPNKQYYTQEILFPVRNYLRYEWGPMMGTAIIGDIRLYNPQ